MPIRYDFRNLPVKPHNYDFRNELRTIGRTEYTDNGVKGRKVDKRWVQARLTFLGKSQAEFAAYLDIHTSAMTNTLDGTRKLQLTEAPLAAEFLNVPLPRVLAAF